MREETSQSKKRTGREWKTFASGFFFAVLLLRPAKSSWLIAPAIFIILCSFLKEAPTSALKKTGKRTSFIAWSGSCLLGLVFSLVWLRSKRLVSLAAFDLKGAMPFLMIALVGTIGAVAFIRKLLDCIVKKIDNTLTGETAGKGRTTLRCQPSASAKNKSFLFVLALAAVTICSTSSPIYPLNGWVDTNCFFTVGKSMWHGIVPYRDLYEQKGPLLYAIYALAYPVSHTSFLGAWIIEVLFSWAFQLFADRCICLVSGRRSYPALLLSTALIFTIPAFGGGGSAEELCLPLLMVSMAFGLRSILAGERISRIGFFLIGVTSGSVLWIKYSMLGFYIGFIIIPAVQMLRRKETKELLTGILLILGGVATISLPVMVYFGYHQALADLWQAYFYNNLFVYGKSSSPAGIIRALGSGVMSMLTYNDGTLLLLLAALTALSRRKEDRALFLFLLLSFGTAFFLIYAGGINMQYYSEILCVFVPVSIAVLMRTVRFENRGKRCAAVLLAASLLGTANLPYAAVKREELPQAKFDKIISETPEATLFNYGALDFGQYTVSDIFPNCRYFCMLNLPSEEMFREMERYMWEGATDYIVSRDLRVETPAYELVAEEAFGGFSYYLYKNIQP